MSRKYIFLLNGAYYVSIEWLCCKWPALKTFVLHSTLPKQHPSGHSYTSVVLNRGWICSRGDILVVRTGRGCATGIWWEEAWVDAVHPTMHRTVTKPRIIWSKCKQYWRWETLKLGGVILPCPVWPKLRRQKLYFKSSTT